MADPIPATSPTDLFLGHIKQAVEGLIPPVNDSDKAWTPPRDGSDPLHQAVTTFASKVVKSEAGLNRVSSLLNWIAATFKHEKDRRIDNAKAKEKIISLLNDCQVEADVKRNYSHTFEQNEIPFDSHITIKSNANNQSEVFQISVEDSKKAMDLYKLSKADLDRPGLEFVMSSLHHSRLINPKFSSLDGKLNEATQKAIATIVKTQLGHFIEARDAEVERLATLMSSITSNSAPETITQAIFQAGAMTGGGEDGDRVEISPNVFQIEFEPNNSIQLIDSFLSQSPFGDDKVHCVSYNGASLHPQAAITNLVPEATKSAFDERLTALLKRAQDLSPMS